MKASETSERYAGKVRECCNYAVRSSKNLVKQTDSEHRQAGGEGEIELRNALKSDLTVFCDEITENPFTFNPKAERRTNIIVFLFMTLSSVLAVLAYFYDPMLILGALISSLFAALSLFGIFSKTGKGSKDLNLYAKRLPAGETKHRIILQANTDAPYKRKTSIKTAGKLKAFTYIGILIYLVFDIVLLLVESGTLNFHGQDEIKLAAFPLAFFIICPAWLSRSINMNASSPGVIDNLIGCYTACGAVRYMSEMDLRLENTELCVLLTSGKFAGNAGAKKFLEVYPAESGVDTVIFCIDSLYEVDCFNAQAKGRKLNRTLIQAADNAGVLLTDHNPKYHKSESEVFEKGNINTVSLTTLPDNPPHFYRSEQDTSEYLKVPPVEAAIKFILESAYLIDGE